MAPVIVPGSHIKGTQMKIEIHPITKYYYTQILLPVGNLVLQTRDDKPYWMRCSNQKFLRSYEQLDGDSNFFMFPMSINISKQFFLMFKGTSNTILEIMIINDIKEAK